MKQVGFLRAIIIIILISCGVSFAQSAATKVARPDQAIKAGLQKGCSFSIIGVWKSDATTETNPIFYSFAPTGWVTVLGHTPGTLPQDFEMMTQAQYRLDDPSAPKRIEFTAKGKNEIFPRDTSSLEVILFSDDSFTVADLATGHRTRWDRIEARRYFLTFVATGGTVTETGPEFAAAWTTLDGRKTEVEAIGVLLKKKDEASTAEPVFEPIAADVYSEFAMKSGGDSTPVEMKSKTAKDGDAKPNEVKSSNSKVMMRLELTESDFERSHRIYEVWEKYVTAKALPNADPYVNAMEFLTRAAESLNQCDEKVKLHKADASKPDDAVTRHKIPQRPLEYIRLMRKKNDELHVSDATFPWAWRPTIELFQ